MKKIIFTMGLIAGFILVIMLGLSLNYMEGHMTERVMRNSELIGYVTMIVALSLIFIGIKSYRDEHLGGSISFGKAFKLGILITLVASFIYVLGWMFLSEVMAPDFMERHSEFTLNSMKEKGASDEEILKIREKMESYTELYKNPLMKAGITFMEVFPIGLLISLISGLILKRNQ